MANPRKGFVIGYSPKITRATGVSTAGGKDLLQTWLKKIAAKWGKKGASDMADQYPDRFAFLLTQHWDCSIFMCVDDTLVMYSRNVKPNLPPQIIAALVANGITQRTPTAWYPNSNFNHLEGSYGEAKEFRASDAISGLPGSNEYGMATVTPHAAEFESMSRIIVDELTGS